MNFNTQPIRTALEVEETIRSHGAIPATVALIEGNICIGTHTIINYG